MKQYINKLGPMTKRFLWWGFAILFFQSGLDFTFLIFETNSFQGGIHWGFALLFPFLIPVFFIAGQYLGCSSKYCSSEECSTVPIKQKDDNIFSSTKMPGV
jgi:hypothetical protein